MASPAISSSQEAHRLLGTTTGSRLTGEAPTLADNVDQVVRFQSAGWNSTAHRSARSHPYPRCVAFCCAEFRQADDPRLQDDDWLWPANPCGNPEGAQRRPRGERSRWRAQKTATGPTQPFVIPDEGPAAWRRRFARCSKRGAWTQAVEALDAKQRAEFERRLRGDLRQDLGSRSSTPISRSSPPKTASRNPLGQSVLTSSGRPCPSSSLAPPI